MKFYQRISQAINPGLLFKLQVLVIFVFCIQPLIAQENKIDERPLAIGVKTERKVVGQELHAYSIQLKRGQVLRVELQEKGADAMIYVARIANPQPIPVSATSNFGSGFMQESITAIADEDGLYGLGIRSIQSDENVDARYEFTATLTDSVTLNDKQRSDAEATLFQAGVISKTNDKEKIPLAIAELEKRVKAWQTLGDTYWEAITKTVIANLASKIGESDKAETNLLQALNLLDKVKNQAEIGNVYFGLGNIYITKKDEAKAKKYFNDVLEISRSIGDKRTEKAFSGVNSMSLRDFADSILTSGMTKKKASDFEKELNDAKKKNDEAAQIEIWNDYLFAVVFGEALDEEPNFAGMSLQENSEDRKLIKKKPLEVYEDAEKDGLRLAKKLKNRSAEMQLLVVLGIGYSESAEEETEEKAKIEKFEKAKNLLIQGLALTKLQNDQLYETLAYAGLSVMYDDDEEKLGIFFGKKFVNSIHSYRKTFVNLASREDQQLIAVYTEGFYGILAKMLTELKRLDESLQVINLSRDQEFFDYKLIDNQPSAKVLLSVTEEINEKRFDKFLNDTIARYANRSNANYFSAADDVKKEFDTLEENFDDESESANDIVQNVKDAQDMKAALNELSKKTGKNHVSIYHFKDNDDDNFLLVTQTGIKFFSDAYEVIPQEYAEDNNRVYSDFLEILSKKKFDISTNSYVDKVCTGGDELLCDPKPLSSVIYKSIFKSIEYIKDEKGEATLEATLDSYNTDIIHWSLSGKLRYIPIAALYDEERRQYLVEQYENVIFTRAKKENFLLPPKIWTNGVGFGGTFANDPKNYLPFVRSELSSIFGDQATGKKGVFNGNVFIDEKFTADSLKLIPGFKPDFVHIATHFNFQPGEAGKSRLYLGDGNSVSLIDFQYADRLFDGVDLLTLSACQTAVQHADASGKEIDGFAELAQRLGARSVIATLWSINDPSAYQLMAKFYNLKQENPDASKSEVLRLAQMSLLNGENTWDAGLKNRITESERGGGIKVKSKVEETTNKYTEVPFKALDKAPFAHPYYWAAFVLYGGSNGGKLTKTYTIPPLPPRIATNTNINNFGNTSSPSPDVTLKDIETSFNNKSYSETVRLGGIFLQSTPDSKEANAYTGLAYLLKQDAAKATDYLEKAIKLGQPLTLPMKRLRIPLLGHAFEEARIILLAEGVAIEADDSVFLAKYADLTDAKINTYYVNFLPQCGTVHLKGVFTEIKKKSEKKKDGKKQFDLFPPSAYLLPKLVGQMTINEAACGSSEDFVPATIISLISRLK